jgi:glucosamine--fructose-6-phosphate aminotransferase (isomerizing)
MERSPLHQQVDTLPELVRVMIEELAAAVRQAFPRTLCRQFQRVFVTGCGDSHHAALAAELAFEQLAGLPCEPMTAMQFGRYGAAYLPATGRGSNLVIAVSVSGRVSRTVEALDMAGQAGATAAAVTGQTDSPLAAAAGRVVVTKVPPLPEELAGQVVPGTRSFAASLLALYLTAIHIGEERAHLAQAEAKRLRHELGHMADLMEQTISISDAVAGQTAAGWVDADQFQFCGAGPNYGTAQFNAAKLLEASGDVAVTQDMEEWAHLQYFGRQVNTPTFLISAGGREASRTVEIAEAAAAIGRRVVTIAPVRSLPAQSPHRGVFFPLAGTPRECFSPLLTSLPGILFAAYRAQVLEQPYFRNFAGGRSAEGGGGISRIRTSQRLKRLV